jgi:hypothetical protein
VYEAIELFVYPELYEHVGERTDNILSYKKF